MQANKDFAAWIHARVREGEGGCLEWAQGCSGKGYPTAHFEGRVRNVRAIVFEQCSPVALGKRQLVMTCRNRLCVNREHMAAKSRAEVQNHWAEREHMALRFSVCAKRRDSAPARKLTMEIAREIRAKLTSGEATVSEMAEAHGVRRAAINRIVNGLSWREHGAANASVFTWRPAA
jgi:hypothetical protein